MRQSEAHGEYEDIQLEKIQKSKFTRFLLFFIIAYRGQEPISASNRNLKMPVFEGIFYLIIKHQNRMN